MRPTRNSAGGIEPDNSTWLRLTVDDYAIPTGRTGGARRLLKKLLPVTRVLGSFSSAIPTSTVTGSPITKLSYGWYSSAIPSSNVENLGTPGYGTYQSLLTMQRLLETKPAPAYFVYLFNGFHEARNSADPTWIRAAARSASGVFFPFAVLSNGQLEARRTNGDIIWPISQHLRSAAMIEEYYERAEAWTRVRNRRALTQALLVKMDQLARSAGAKFTVVLFDDLQKPDWLAYREFLSAHAIAFANCDLPELSKPGYRQPDGHPNAKMSELLSQCVDPTSAVARAF